MGEQSRSVIWAVVPAAGVGSRMGSPVPKQYLKLQGKPVLSHTLQRLLELPDIRKIVVAVSAEELLAPDSHWQQLDYHRNPRIQTCMGADSRHGSVINALTAIADQAHDDDWIMVHDAVRPCVRIRDISRLISALKQHPVGGLLSAPVRDTLKLADSDGNSVQRTLDRRHVWSAFTPQMFRYGLLRTALHQASGGASVITDEAAAVEAMGWSPLLIAGNPDNIKITHPDDLPLASAILTAQTSERTADV
jgi:2-C-methyl-D-erythritol 4-phosphate cytidylyltransferase